MRILENNIDKGVTSESYNSYTSRYEADLNGIKKTAQMGKGPGYPLISGSNVVTLLDSIIQKMDNDIRDGRLHDLDDNRIQRYANMFRDTLEAIDILHNQAVALDESSKLAKSLLNKVKSDIEKVNDTFIKIEE